MMAKRLVSVHGTYRGFVEVFEPLLYERCQGEIRILQASLQIEFHYYL
jgi:hypothetical protein